MGSGIRVLVNGANGRMGSEAVKVVEGASDMDLVAAIDEGDDLHRSIISSHAQVAVDFTIPAVANENANIIRDTGVGGVIGTTGFTPEQIEELELSCQDRSPAILIAPNFAIGALLLMHFSKIAGKHMPDVEIIELHHPGKLDAPSGTAVKTAELIAESRGKPHVSRETFEEGARGQLFNDIPVHSVRLPGFLAYQEVIFGGEGQSLTIRHDSQNRSCFMPGVLLGIREVMQRKGLIYGLDRILFENE